jgi:hypothetical protein
MPYKSIPWFLWLIPIGLLLLAVERMPYGYYTVTRIVVCAFAAVLAWLAWEDGGATSVAWAIVFSLIAILFNPFFPIYLTRATWAYFDIGSALIFAAHLVLGRLWAPRPKTKGTAKRLYVFCGAKCRCWAPSVISCDARR